MDNNNGEHKQRSSAPRGGRPAGKGGYRGGSPVPARAISVGLNPLERVVAENLAFHLRAEDRGGSDFKKRNGHGSKPRYGKGDKPFQ